MPAASEMQPGQTAFQVPSTYSALPSALQPTMDAAVARGQSNSRAHSPGTLARQGAVSSPPSSVN